MCGGPKQIKLEQKVPTPLIQKAPSFFLDTGAFLNNIRQLCTKPTEAFLVSFDVKDLYTSIPHSHGIESVNQLLLSSGMDTDQINLCVELLSLVLTTNFFMFQEKYYLNICGTAMGSNAAPPYANCYLADYERTVIYTSHLYQNNVFLWKRYIDGIFCRWGGTVESLNSFFELLNPFWPGLSFTMSYGTKYIFWTH
ncbi:unnamed protein product [Ranitomeya imitator]|uniref:Reverse transcriptase domain-containing protein n=1 Tax=Ranitomeya imitator TaxID=111125 RepID=A0ABN9LG75_9NEOB|nr:unnamed protein product [Ranitomeya imitator]